MLFPEPRLSDVSGFWLNFRLQCSWLNSLKDTTMFCLSSWLLFCCQHGLPSNFEATWWGVPWDLYPDWPESLCSMIRGAPDPENDTKFSGIILHRVVMERSLLVRLDFTCHMLITHRRGIITKGQPLTAAREIHRVLRIQSTSRALPCPWQLVTICNYSLL